MRISVLASLFVLLVACGNDLEPKNDGKQPTEPGESRITNVRNDDGTLTTIVDASAPEGWVYVDLDEAVEVEESAGTWDLAFQRTNIVSNGAGGVLVAKVAGKDPFAVPAESEFHGDPADRDLAKAEGAFSPDDTDDPTAEGAWYAYNLATHTLSIRENVYFVKSDEGTLFALIFLDYYDDARSPGFPKFRWGEVPQ